MLIRAQRPRPVILMRALRAEDLRLARANNVTQKQVLRPLCGHQDDNLGNTDDFIYTHYHELHIRHVEREPQSAPYLGETSG